MRSASSHRFVTFAFAAADLLVEVDRAGTIRFASGATRLFTGLEGEALVGRPFHELFHAADRELAAMLLSRATAGRRAGPVMTRAASGKYLGRARALAGPAGDCVAVALSDIRPVRSEIDVSASGLLDREAFTGLVLRALEDGAENGEAHLSLLVVDGLPEAEAKVGGTIVGEVLQSVSAIMRLHAADGEAAATLAPGRYAVLHEEAAAGEAMEEEIRDVLTTHDLHSVVGLSRRTLDLTDGSATGDQASQALAYVLSSFVAAGAELHFDSLGEALAAKLQDTLERVADIRRTIRDVRFAIHYQPIVRLDDRTLHHYEALTRFEDGLPTGGTIAFAEQVGMIAEFDLVVVRQSVDYLRRLLTRDPGLRVAVNISARSLGSDTFVEALRRLLRAADIPARALLFEITESFEIVDLDRADGIIQSFRIAGHEVCLDDFGAGAAAFHYIRNLGVDYIKLDGSYTRKLIESARETSIVTSIIQLCRSLKIATIVEMVESEEERKKLLELGADYGQGYLFGRPRPEIPLRKPTGAATLGRRKGLREDWG